MYSQAMRWGKQHPKGTKQPVIFSTVKSNERRRIPWLGGVWFEEGKDEKRLAFIRQWHEDTEQMLKENPSLIIID